MTKTIDMVGAGPLSQDALEQLFGKQEEQKKPTINKLLKSEPYARVVMMTPGSVPQSIRAEKIPPEFMSRKLRTKRIDTLKGKKSRAKMVMVYDLKSKEPLTIADSGKAYRGTVLIINTDFNALYTLAPYDADEVVVWLMSHKV